MTGLSETSNKGPRIIVALDYDNAADALAFAESVNPADCRLKIGLELFTLAGPPLIEKLASRGFDVFLDLKFHDIPNTVAQGPVAPLLNWGVDDEYPYAWRARDAGSSTEAVDASSAKPLLIGVTILTSHNEEDLRQIGLTHSPSEMVAMLASMAQQAGLDGVVCSPLEASQLKQVHGDSFVLVTPGVRPAGSDSNDQRRVMTPVEALAQGSDYLVIGRPITRAPDPVAALAEINASIAG